MSVVRRFVATVGASAVVAAGLVSLAPPAHAAGEQPVPGHTSLVPSVPRKDTPKVNGGEIWDIEVVGNRVFVAGGFTSLTNKTGTNNTVNQAQIAAYNLDTGRIDETFRPTVNGSVAAVEASPDGTKLYIGGAFSAVNGVAKKNFALLNITTGAPVATFAANASSKVDSLAATNTTLYVGGRFTKINGVSRTALAAVNGATGAVDAGFVNNLSGGIGVDGALTVQQLRLTHDNSTLVAVHTGRRMNDQDRYGVAMVDVATKQMLPWSTRLWQDNLSVVGGIQRICAGLDLDTVGQAVAVGVGDRRVGGVGVDLITIVEAIGVGVGVEGVAAERDLLTVDQSILINIGVERIRPRGLDLGAVVDAIVVRVVLGGIRAGLVDLLTVVEAVAVGVDTEGVGAVVVHLLTVAEAVEVGVRLEGIRAQVHLVTVVEAVAVGVGDDGIGAGLELVAVVEAVAVGVGEVGIRAELNLFAVEQAVVVGVVVEAVGQAVAVGVGDVGVCLLYTSDAADE